MTNSTTKAHGSCIAAVMIIATLASGLSRAEIEASDQLPACVIVDEKTLRFVGPRRLIKRCSEMESGCKVTYKLTLDDLGLAMDASVYSLEPGDPQLEPYWLRPGRAFIGKEFTASSTHCLWRYEVKGSKDR